MVVFYWFLEGLESMYELKYKLIAKNYKKTANFEDNYKAKNINVYKVLKNNI